MHDSLSNKKVLIIKRQQWNLKVHDQFHWVTIFTKESRTYAFYAVAYKYNLFTYEFLNYIKILQEEPSVIISSKD